MIILLSGIIEISIETKIFDRIIIVYSIEQKNKKTGPDNSENILGHKLNLKKRRMKS